MWFQFFLWVAGFVLSDYFRERLPAQTPSGIGDFNIPTATEGRVVPIIPGGTPFARALNCIYYSDFKAVPRTVTTGVIFRDEEVIGFTYELALQYAIFKGRCAGITGVFLGDEELYRGVALSVVDIDRPDIFGGVNSGGGFVARIRLFDGAEDQPVSAFLNTRLDPLPAYRGTAYVMVTDIAESAGANIGEQNTLRHLRLEVQAFDDIAGTAGIAGLGDELGLANDHHIIGPDANPISVAYNLYANTRWGRKKPINEINVTNFRAVAETCFTEGIGFTMMIDEGTTHDSIQDAIEQHIDGYIGPNPVTNQVEVTLARQDYIPANEFQANASNIQRIEKWDKGDWSETFNRVRLRYTDRDKQWKESHAIDRAAGNQLIQGETKTKDVRYQGCHTAAVASLLAARARRALSQPVRGGTVAINRTAYLKRPGGIIVFTSLKAREVDLPCRITKADVGDAKKNEMVFELVADSFGTEIANASVPGPSLFVPPVQAVVAFDPLDQAAATVPYTLMQYDSASNSIPRIITLARRTVGAPTRYEVIRRTRVTFGSGAYGAFVSSGFITAGFCTCGQLRAAAGAWEAGNGTLTMSIDPIGAESLDGIIGAYGPDASSAAGIAVISPGDADEEWLSFTSIVDDGAGIRLEGLYRSSFDSPMIAHAINARIWFVWTGGMGLPDEVFTPGHGIEVKLLPTSPTDAILEPAATAISEIEMLNTSRHARPLLPRLLTINDTEFPTTPQTADFAAQTTPTIINGLLFGIESRLWNHDDVIRQVRGLDISGNAISDAVWLAQTVNVEYWLYDLDTTPSPIRNTDDIVTGTLAWDESIETFIISRQDLIDAGIIADFAARLEIETEHSPSGETPNQLSRIPMFFDFDITGDFTLIPFIYSDVAFHSHFDGVDAATAAVDESDQALTMTFVANAQLDTAQSVFGGSSVLFDGVGDVVTVPHDAVFDLAGNDFTIQFRLRFNGDPGVGNFTFLAKWNETGGATQRSWAFAITNNNLRFNYSENGSTSAFIDRAWDPAGDTWYAMEVNRIGDVLRFFVDGIQIGTDIPFAFTLFNNDATGFNISGIDAVGFVQILDGWIEELRIINGVGLHAANYTIDADEFFFHRISVLAKFNGADAATVYTTLDRFAQTTTFVGNAQLDTSVKKFDSASLLLDGDGDMVTLPDGPQYDFAAEDFTIELQARWAVDPGTADDALVNHWDGAAERAWFFGLSNNLLNFFYSTTGADVFQIDSGAFDPVVDQWYHLAVCRDGSNLRFFVDGVQSGVTGNIGAAVIFDATTVVRIGGRDVAFAQWLDGNIDEVRVTKGKALYTANFTPPTTGFDAF